MFIRGGQPLLWMAQIRYLQGEISVEAGASPVWPHADHPRHPCESSLIQMTLGEISNRYAHYLDHVLADQ